MLMLEIVGKNANLLILRDPKKLIGILFYTGFLFACSGFLGAFMIPEGALGIVTFNVALLFILVFLRYRNHLVIFDRGRNAILRRNDLFGWVYHERILGDISQVESIRIQGRISHGRGSGVYWDVEIRTNGGVGVPLFDSFLDLLAVRTLVSEIARFLGVGFEEIDETGKVAPAQPTDNAARAQDLEESEKRRGSMSLAALSGTIQPIARPTWVSERETTDSYEANAPYSHEFPGGWQIPCVVFIPLLLDLYDWAVGKNLGVKPISILFFMLICFFFLAYNRRARTSVTLDKSTITIVCSTFQGDVTHWIDLSDLVNITMEATNKHYGLLHFICRNQQKSIDLQVTNPFGHYLEYQLKTRLAR